LAFPSGQEDASLNHNLGVRGFSSGKEREREKEREEKGKGDRKE
jgi:hypothetical protein